jgi:hypothetical protein
MAFDSVYHGPKALPIAASKADVAQSASHTTFEMKGDSRYLASIFTLIID